MKKISLILVCILTLFGLIGCTGGIFNKLDDEEFLIYESADETIRLEIVMTKSNQGRLYVTNGGVEQSFVVVYFIAREHLYIYFDSESYGNADVTMEVSYQYISYFKRDYDIMYLTEHWSNDENNIFHKIFTDFNVTLSFKLYRVYDEEISPLLYYDNVWTSSDNSIILTNNNLEAYSNFIIYGTFYDEEIWITFNDDMFIIYDKVSSNIKLSGSYSFDGLNIILNPLESYVGYPDTFTLIFSWL